MVKVHAKLGPKILKNLIPGAQCALSVKQFSVGKRITMLEHPPYSQDLAPYDFYLFLKIKNELRTHFQSVDEVNAKTADLLKIVTPNELQQTLNGENSYAASYALIEKERDLFYKVLQVTNERESGIWDQIFSNFLSSATLNPCHTIKQGWVDFSRVRATSNFFKCCGPPRDVGVV
ncbi:hypothetical protein TNCV_167601 [Trichonephila clavipes]|nr:hypothetical protein TNCV_167601 [Trichonephila clavipes]